LRLGVIGQRERKTARTQDRIGFPLPQRIHLSSLEQARHLLKEEQQLLLEQELFFVLVPECVKGSPLEARGDPRAMARGVGVEGLPEGEEDLPPEVVGIVGAVEETAEEDEQGG